MVTKERRYVTLIPAYFDFFDVCGDDVVLANKTQHLVHDPCRYRSTGKSLDQIPGRGKHPRIAEMIHDRARVKTATGRLEKAKRRLQNIVGRRPTKGREISGYDSIFGGVPSVKRLRHRSKIISETTGL